MTACIVCGVECPPRRPGHNGGGRPRVLCGAVACKRARDRELVSGYRLRQRDMTGTAAEYETALKTLRQLASRRGLRLRARAHGPTYKVRLFDGKVWLTGAEGKPLEAIKQVHQWLRAYHPAEKLPRQVEAPRDMQDFRGEQRMSAADYAWGAA